MPTKPKIKKVWDKDAWIVEALLAHVIAVDKRGRIWRDPYGVRTLVKISTHAKTGRRYFMLSYKGIRKSVLVNRAVGLALIPNPCNLPEVNHKDGDKSNNHP